LIGSLSAKDWHKRFLQQSRWTSELRNYLFQLIGLTEKDTILEVGCGTGALLTDLQSILGNTKSRRIHGLDINLEFLELASQNVPDAILCLGDAHTLPYENRSFDFTFCHFLLLWVTDPLKVVTEMKRVTKRGGYIAALAEPDYGGRIDYPAELSQLGELQCASLKNQGADPLMGRKLASLFKEVGVRSVKVGVLGGQWKFPLSEKEIEAEWQIIKHDITGLIPSSELERLHQSDLKHWGQQSRVLYVPTFYAWGKV